ncbi:MAG: hypothetical protein Alpg2KO_28120 [Alphaproteobacteria bacterium]
MLIRLLLLGLAVIGAMTAWRWVRANILEDGPALPREEDKQQVKDAAEDDSASDLLECKNCDRYVPATDSGNCPRCGGSLSA